MLGLLNKIHSTPPERGMFFSLPRCPIELPERMVDVVTSLLDSISPLLLSCQETSAAIAGLVPPNQFWRWKDMWSFSLRNAVFTATMVEYLKSGTLATIAQVSEILGSKFAHSM